jgi:hypothetical protein
MGKAVRNRRIRKRAYIIDPTGKHTRKIARLWRRSARMPILDPPGGSAPRVQDKWTSGNRRLAKKYSDFRRRKKKKP